MRLPSVALSGLEFYFLETGGYARFARLPPAVNRRPFRAYLLRFAIIVPSF